MSNLEKRTRRTNSNHAAAEAECRVKEANYKRARKQAVLIISVAGT